MLAMTPTLFTLSLHLLSLLHANDSNNATEGHRLSRLHKWPKDLIFFSKDLTVGRAEISSQGKA